MSNNFTVLEETPTSNHDYDSKLRTIVRVKTNMYSSGGGAVIKKTITTLKRKSYGYDLLYEEISSCDAEFVLSRIINIYEVEDGVYELVTTNISTDFETGIVDDYDYKLIPYTDEVG